MKKFLTSLLCVMMVACFMPSMAWADDVTGEGTTLPSANDAGVIVLDKDYNVATLDPTGTYDLNSHNLTVTGTVPITVKNGNTLTILDSSVSEGKRGGTLTFAKKSSMTVSDICPEAGGTATVSNIHIVSPNSVFYPSGDAAAVNVTDCDIQAGCYCVGTNAKTVDNYGVVITLKNSNLTASNEDKDNCPVMINVEGTLKIDNCSITGERQGVVVRAGDATITNSLIKTTGEYTGTSRDADNWTSGNEVNMAALVAGNNPSSKAYNADANVTIVDTEISGTDEVPAVYVNVNNRETYGTELRISGENTKVGTLSGNETVIEKAEIQITGGTFSSDVSDYIPSGMTQDNDGVVTPNPNAEAKIGDAYYATLAEAITAAQAGDTINLLKDIDSETVITIPTGVTLDGSDGTAQHSINLTGTLDNGAFILASGNGVTIQNVTINTNGKAKHGIQYYRVDGGKVDNVTVNGGSFTSIIVNGAKVEITDSTLNPDATAYANIEYAMGSGVTEIPEITLNNVTGVPEKPLVYADEGTINRVKENDSTVKDETEAVAKINSSYLKGAKLTYVNGTDVVPGTVTYLITFDANGGTVTPASATTNNARKLASLPTPTRSGSYSFKGWYTAANGGKQITADTEFSANTTAYAQWTYTGSVPTTPTTQKPVIEPNADVTTSLSTDGTTLTIKANDGYEITDVTVNGVSKGAVDKLTGLKTGDKVVIKTQKVEKPDDNAALIEAVKNTKLVARSTMSKAKGKKAVKVYWYAKDSSDLDFDGYEVYRSLKRYSGFGKTPFFKTSNEKYYNTAIKKGTKYYYKVRAYKVIGGEKVYTDWSTKAWRTVK